MDKGRIEELIRHSMKIREELLDDVHDIKRIADEIIDCFHRGGKLLVFGNGGSAADSQHIAGELVGRFKLERKGLPAIALTTDTSVLTAWSNDYDFSTVFSRQVEALAEKGDVLLGISTSGSSKNVIKAFEKGKEMGLTIISLTGKEGGKVKSLSNFNININSNDTPRIQEAHMLVYHILCELIEEGMVE